MKNNLLRAALLTTLLSTGAFAGSYYLGPTISIQHVSASNSSANSVQPTLSLGYGDLTGDTYYAGELFVTPFSSTLSSSQSPGATNAKITRAIGISFIPGMKVYEDVIGYARVGVISGRFSGLNSAKLGGQLGLGFQIPVSRVLDFRAEYIFTVYRSMAFLGTPKVGSFGLGVIYKFGS